MNNEQTIAALCTPPGGAISVIRVSGRESLLISNEVWKGAAPLSKRSSRVMHLGKCAFSGEASVGDSVLAVYMPAPNSYTGEDVVELHCHGGTLVSKRLLERVLAAGARHANPGEFTLRAFLNAKLDLTQAEAVADIISAHGEMALNLAEKQMSGALGDRMRDIRSELTRMLSESESRMDFPDEELDWQPIDALIKSSKRCSTKISELLVTSEDGVILREGARIVIAGRPNAGKSSLLNLILGSNRAIVTPIPGTTRDTIEEFASIRGIPVRIIDTAGIREAENTIEEIGVGRSLESLKTAKIVLWVLDASQNQNEEIEKMREHLSSDTEVIAVWNKVDIAEVPLLDGKTPPVGLRSVTVSALANTGLERLYDAIEDIVWSGKTAEEPEVAVNARHTELLMIAAEALETLPDNLSEEEWELASSKIRAAVHALGTITGEDADPDVLDDIFSRFCIGK